MITTITFMIITGIVRFIGIVRITQLGRGTVRITMADTTVITATADIGVVTMTDIGTDTTTEAIGEILITTTATWVKTELTDIVEVLRRTPITDREIRTIRVLAEVQIALEAQI